MSDNGKTSSQDKRAAVESFMAIGMVMLHLDARVPGVRVPSRLQNEFQLRLNISPRFSPPDLEIDDWGIHQTLSFGGSPFPVAVPWVAIYGLSNVLGEMRLYPQAMPDELFEAVSLSQGKTREELALELKTRQRDDGKSPTPVLTFKPVAAPPKRPVPPPPPPPPVRHAPPSSPGPTMMRRKGGLALVAPPPEEPEDEPSSVAEEAPSGDATAAKKRGRKAKAASPEKKAASPKTTAAKGKKAASPAKKKAAEGAGAEESSAAKTGKAKAKQPAKKSSAKAVAGEKKAAARKKAPLERPGEDETSPTPPEPPPRKPFTLRIVK